MAKIQQSVGFLQPGAGGRYWHEPAKNGLYLHYEQNCAHCPIRFSVGEKENPTTPFGERVEYHDEKGFYATIAAFFKANGGKA